MANSIMQMFYNMNSMNNMNNGMSPNLLMLASAIKNGNNPQALINMMASQNPKIQEMMSLLQGKSSKDLESICKELCKQNGIDFDSTLQQIQSLLR